MTCFRCKAEHPGDELPVGWVRMQLGRGEFDWTRTLCDDCNQSLYDWLLGEAS